MKRLKLAYISPLPPQKSGISYYSKELLEYLHLYYDIDVIVSNDAALDIEQNKNYEIKSVDYFKINNSLYERVLYHFGNSPFHSYMLELLEEIEGVVVLHDFYLSDLINFSKTLNQNLLYKLHGYKASMECTDINALIKLISKLPANRDILNRALGVIVHANYPKLLVEKYYYKPKLDNWHKIPLLREAPRKQVLFSKEDLGVPTDAFVVCSFGMLGRNKQNDKLLDAWMNSSLSKDTNCYLIFAGENDASEYGQKLQKSIEAHKNIKITGWIDTETFDAYLSISDIAVQLRTDSRGETSAAVLDTMNYGVSTIVNANGSMAELPQDALYMLEDDFKTEELTYALETLYKDKVLRDTLSSKASAYIQTYHAPSNSALLYHKAIEEFYEQTKNYKHIAVEELSKNIQDLAHLVETLSLSYFDSINQRQILIDISSIVKHDLKTGIQRVVRSQLLELIKNAPDNYRIEPIYLSQEDVTYIYARSYTSKLLGLKEFSLKDEPVHVNSGDIFYGLDLNAEEVSICTQSALYEKYKLLGVKFFFVVYDLLPILRPRFFPPYAKETHTKWLQNITQAADELICISKTVADEVAKLSSGKVSYLHLGADIHDGVEISNKNGKAPTFLMVGTIEPRKGHAQTLEAFETFWRQNIDINLTIVGKKGWMVDEFMQKLTTHPELNRHLKYLEGISDKELSKLYADSDALIAASEDEGFGLPLIEAAQYSLPIIARDISVFREVASNYAYYFKDTKDSKELASSIKEWLTLYKDDCYPKSSNMSYMSWEENAKKLLEMFK